MRVALILAMSDNNVIGDKLQIPWHLPKDLRFFKRTTLGKPVIMGRKTFESIGKALPGRQNIVLSKDPEFEAEGAIVVSDLESALWAAADVDEVMIIGGAQIYKTALPLADRIYLTEVHADLDGDIVLDWALEPDFSEVSREEHQADAKHAYPYSFVVLDRKK